MMVLLDCAANLAVIGVMCLAFPVRVWGDPYLCIIFHFYRVFVATINRRVYFENLSESFANSSFQDDPPCGGDIPSADGLPRGVLLEVRGEDHQG